MILEKKKKKIQALNKQPGVHVKSQNNRPREALCFGEASRKIKGKKTLAQLLVPLNISVDVCLCCKSCPGVSAVIHASVVDDGAMNSSFFPAGGFLTSSIVDHNGLTW